MILASSSALVPVVAGFGRARFTAIVSAAPNRRTAAMSVQIVTPNHGPHDAATEKRRRKRPSIRAMIKEAKAAGLEIAAIECDESGIKIVCASHAATPSADDDSMDQRMTEQMGVARLGGRARR
jgi:hypothetical protein